MKRFTILFLSLAVLTSIAALTSAQSKQNSLMSFRWVSHLTPPEMPASKAAPAFEKLKSLAGEWQGKDSKGGALKVSYQLISNGSSVMETLMPEKEPSMVTIYHLDGDNLMMTHYCSMANQPRMRAMTPAGEIKKLNFTFVDGTNMAKPTDAHMHSLSLTFQDNDHLVHEWSMKHEGKDMPVVFNLERAK